MVEISNAFVGKASKPTETELAGVLGKSAAAWSELVRWLAEELGVAEPEWKSISRKYGWSLRLKQKKRTIVYLSPAEGFFQVSLVLGDKAVKAAQESQLPKNVVETIEAARRYAEGTGIRLVVRGVKDLVAIRQLVAIKLAH